jgi:hypothetical protein
MTARTVTSCEPAKMRKLMNDPVFDAVRPRARRRLLVSLHAALGLGVIAAMAGLYLGDSLWWLAAILPLLAIWMIATGVLNASIRGLTELKSDDLDEREAPVRDRVYAKLWWPAIALSFAPACGLIVLDTSLEIAMPVLLGCYLLTLGLPAYWLAWTLPDEPAAD